MLLISIYANAAMLFVGLWKMPRAFRKKAIQTTGRWSLPDEIKLIGTPLGAQLFAGILGLGKQPYLYAAVTILTAVLFVWQLKHYRRA